MNVFVGFVLLLAENCEHTHTHTRSERVDTMLVVVLDGLLRYETDHKIAETWTLLCRHILERPRFNRTYVSTKTRMNRIEWRQ